MNEPAMNQTHRIKNRALLPLLACAALICTATLAPAQSQTAHSFRHGSLASVLSASGAVVLPPAGKGALTPPPQLPPPRSSPALATPQLGTA